MHWISAWVLVILLATAYEAIAGRGRLVDHPEAIGRIAFGVAVTVGVISYVVQKKRASRRVIVLISLLYCGAAVGVIEAGRGQSLRKFQAGFLGKCRAECQAQTENCPGDCDCIWRELHSAYPEWEDVEELFSLPTRSPDEFRKRIAPLKAACAAIHAP